MPEPTIPSVNPADFDSWAAALQFIIKKALQQVGTCHPATVIGYDRTKNRAEVQPMIQVLNTDKELVNRAPIKDVPVFSFGGGGFNINFPLEAGDTGEIIACDRDISLYLQSNYQLSPPNTLRLQSYSDAIFFPDMMDKFTTVGEDGRAVFQKTDGSVRISLGDTDIKITAPQQIDMTAAATINLLTALVTTQADLQVGAKFGCNGTAPQAAYVLGAAAVDLPTVIALANNIRLALIANGIGQ